MRIEEQKVIPVLTSANIGASTAMDSIDITKLHRVTYLVTCGACTGDVTFTLTTGATNGATTTQVPFKYAMGSAAIGSTLSDVLSAEVNDADGSVALTCTTKMVVIDFDCAAAGAGHKFLTLTAAATAGIVHAVAVAEPRYAGSQSATCV
jgi:hypothetical protein